MSHAIGDSTNTLSVNSTKTNMRNITMSAFVTCSLLTLLLSGCSQQSQAVRSQTLPSGKTVQITSFQLVCSEELGIRSQSDDNFNLEYVSLQPDARDEQREIEAREVFELIRTTSEAWGFQKASLSAFPSATRFGRYDSFVFERMANGKWSCNRLSLFAK
jgi:hypothetical protein